MKPNQHTGFSPINSGYNRVFKRGKLSVGLVVPIENYDNASIPSMQRHIERVQLAEELGFSAVWLRDIPFNVPSFGDAGQLYDPFVYLGALALQTRQIALGVSSVILPLRHPSHIAKAAATADQLSQGRLILGIASGDRPEEYPAHNTAFESRGERFRESYEYIRAMATTSPTINNSFGHLHGHIEMLPKPVSDQIPMLITGTSQQSRDWIAENTNGWITYPRAENIQRQLIEKYRSLSRAANLLEKPVMEPLYIDLLSDDNASPTPIHLGLRLGIKHLRKYLKTRRDIGVNHIALNLRFNRLDPEKTIQKLANELLPDL